MIPARHVRPRRLAALTASCTLAVATVAHLAQPDDAAGSSPQTFAEWYAQPQNRAWYDWRTWLDTPGAHAYWVWLTHPHLPDVLHRIASCEGWPHYVHADHGPESSASGKYGFLDGTWRRWRGEHGASFARAMHAPEWVQDRAALALYRHAGTAPWDASRGCWT